MLEVLLAQNKAFKKNNSNWKCITCIVKIIDFGNKEREKTGNNVAKVIVCIFFLWLHIWKRVLN